MFRLTINELSLSFKNSDDLSMIFMNKIKKLSSEVVNLDKNNILHSTTNKLRKINDKNTFRILTSENIFLKNILRINDGNKMKIELFNDNLQISLNCDTLKILYKFYESFKNITLEINNILNDSIEIKNKNEWKNIEIKEKKVHFYEEDENEEKEEKLNVICNLNNLRIFLLTREYTFIDVDEEKNEYLLFSLNKLEICFSLIK